MLWILLTGSHRRELLCVVLPRRAQKVHTHGYTGHVALRRVCLLHELPRVLLLL